MEVSFSESFSSRENPRKRTGHIISTAAVRVHSLGKQCPPQVVKNKMTW